MSPGDHASPGATRLVLVRHGETVWHAENRYAGAGSDVDLTPRGRQQAGQLARWAATSDFDALIVSPVRRARETAEVVAAATGLLMQVEDDLREVDFGLAEGRTEAELARLDTAMVDRFRTDPLEHPYPGAERVDLAADRVAGRLRALAEEHRGGRLLVIAHNTALRLGLCRLLDVPVARYRFIFPQLHTGALTEISLPVAATQVAALLRLNAPPQTPDADEPANGASPHLYDQEPRPITSAHVGHNPKEQS